MTTRLVNAPLPHRLLHGVTARGLRGEDQLWSRLLGDRYPRGAELDVDGQRIAIDEAGVGTGPHLREVYGGGYERNVLPVIRRLVRPGWVCVDVGANIGIYTTLLRSVTGGSGRVVAVEPLPHLANRLRMLGPGAPLDVVEAAVGEESGTADLHVFPVSSMVSTLRSTNIPGTTTVAVEVRRLDDIAAALPQVHFMKIDVEELELSTLRGATAVLSRTRNLMIEVSVTFPEVAALLAGSFADHAWFTTASRLSRTRVLKRPALRRTSPAGVGALFSQVNLLLVDPRDLPRIASYVTAD